MKKEQTIELLREAAGVLREEAYYASFCNVTEKSELPEVSDDYVLAIAEDGDDMAERLEAEAFRLEQSLAEEKENGTLKTTKRQVLEAFAELFETLKDSSDARAAGSVASSIEAIAYTLYDIGILNDPWLGKILRENASSLAFAVEKMKGE